MKNLETERKFLVNRDRWNQITKPPGAFYTQGYLCIDEEKVVRIRVAGDQGYITIKGKGENFSRPEFEYSIPVGEAVEMLDLFVPNRISKVRTVIQAGAHKWEVDEFDGDNEGLIVAEIELETPEEVFEVPDWIGEEVTADRRYYNAYLSLHPYGTWGKKEPPEGPWL